MCERHNSRFEMCIRLLVLACRVSLTCSCLNCTWNILLDRALVRSPSTTRATNSPSCAFELHDTSHAHHFLFYFAPKGAKLEPCVVSNTWVVIRSPMSRVLAPDFDSFSAVRSVGRPLTNKFSLMASQTRKQGAVPRFISFFPLRDLKYVLGTAHRIAFNLRPVRLCSHVCFSRPWGGGAWAR